MENKTGKRPVATVGALVENGGEVFLVKTVKWSGTYGIPGGKVEYGETLNEALRREMSEETGLKIKNIRLACVQDCIRPEEFIDREAHFLLFNYFAETGSRDFVLNDEATEGLWIKPDRALRLNLNKPTKYLIGKYLAQG